ncbi:MAG: type II secretory pathway component PulC [Alteromonas naphthalenivorans]|jgi:type II secretory pathway component PulC
MRHPFWIINSSLLLLFAVCLGFVFLSRPIIPKPKKVKAKAHVTAHHVAVINIANIYDNDLFDTYHEQVKPAVEPDYAKPIPNPPGPTTVHLPDEPKQPFLPPLEATLKGIMLLSDESNNIAVIADNKTKKDENYKVGDPIEDAQVVRILRNKVILIRSNGQQETLYLNGKSADTDSALVENEEDWSHLIKKISNHDFLLDPQAFTDLVPNLAHFIDMFDLTTVYKEGKSIGCRIGKITHSSLGVAMGLEPYSIVNKIAGIPATKTDERLHIYNKLTSLKIGDSCIVEITHNHQPITLTFKLHDLRDPLTKDRSHDDDEEETGALKGPSDEELERERIATLKERHTFAPTVQEIMIDQRKKMLAEGKAGKLKDFSLPKES